MTALLDLDALFGPTADRTIEDAADRVESCPDLVLSTGARHRFDHPLLIGRPCRNGEAASNLVGPTRVDVTHPSLSRDHATISPVGRRAAVVDLGSTNGTVIVAPDRLPIVCRPGRLVLVDIGWRIEFGGAVWAHVELNVTKDLSETESE